MILLHNLKQFKEKSKLGREVHEKVKSIALTCSEHVMTNGNRRILLILIFLLTITCRLTLYVHRVIHLVIKVDLFVILEARLAISR